MPLPRMRFLDEAYEEIKKLDPNTAIPKSYIKKLVKTGVIPTVKVGRRELINVEMLIDYLANPTEPPQQTVQGVRRIG